MKPRPRSIKISLWHVATLCGIMYLLLMWLGYRHLERNLSQRQSLGQVFHPKFGQDGSLQFYVNECPLIHNLHSVNSSSLSSKNDIKSLKSGMCPLHSRPLRSNIQVEREWSSISVGYPQYVYTVSGWIQVIDVPNYSARSLRVIIVPHSHQDLGWKDTFEGYFESFTKQILNNVVKHLLANPTWKFIWSEVSNLERWYYSPGSDREGLKKLITNGQLEIVTGGWVMTDEAVAHYGAMLDQLVEGHQWLYDTLGVIPNTSWSVDPFGHSPTMAYFLKNSGVEKMVIQRAHFGIKRHFAQNQNLEFVWRQAWDSDGKTGILCHLMPFLLYAIQYSCGPDPHVCCQYDFHGSKCFRGSESVSAEEVNDTNIRKLAWALWEQFQKKAQLYQSNVLLVPHGDDFRYTSKSEWKQQFGNLGKLMEYMNKDKDMDIKVEFGTISDYFNALKSDVQKSQVTFPSLTGDFFPYNDRDDQYWTGFYSLRPLFKHMGRILQAKLRITEIIFSLTYGQHSKQAREFYAKHAQILVDAHRTLGLFQHHDAITGTSKKFVMEDYGDSLQRAIAKVDTLLSMLMVHSLTVDLQKYEDLPPDSVLMTQEWAKDSSPPSLRISPFNDKWYVMVTNPLTVPWTSPVTVRTASPVVVKTRDGAPVPSQVIPVFASGLQVRQNVYDVVFIADLPALSTKMYEIVEDGSQAVYARVTLFGQGLEPAAFSKEFQPTKSKKGTVEIETNMLRATFSTCAGTLQYTQRKSDGVVHHTEVKMVTYGTGSWINPFKDKSGAYVFMPDGQAREVDIFYPSMAVITGPVMSSLISQLPGTLHSTSLYNISGPMGAGVHIDNQVDLADKTWANKELAMRIVTDVISPDSSLCVDLNGFQMHKKKWRAKMLIQGNFHPMTSMAFIEDADLSRISLISGQSHGVASLQDGTLEVILDRRLMQDDWRGLNEGPKENKPSPSKFILLPEKKAHPGQYKGPTCYPSALAHLLSSHMSNPQQAAFMEDVKKEFKSEARFLSQSWPCLYDLLTLRSRANAGATTDASFNFLLLLHRAGLDCSFTEVHIDCDLNTSVNISSLNNLRVDSAMEMSLTGVKEIGPLRALTIELNDMEIKTIRITAG